MLINKVIVKSKNAEERKKKQIFFLFLKIFVEDHYIFHKTLQIAVYNVGVFVNFFFTHSKLFL